MGFFVPYIKTDEINNVTILAKKNYALDSRLLPLLICIEIF